MTREAELLSDGELIRRTRAGDREMYGLLVKRHQEALYRFAFGMVRDADAAADLVQDSFVNAYIRIASCRDPERFDAWVFRILRNHCLDHLKNVRRKNVSADTLVDVASEASDPGTDLERGDLERALQTAVGELPEAQREAFLLKHVEDLSYEEMADLLGVNTSALKMRVKRAREALQAVLGGVTT